MKSLQLQSHNHKTLKEVLIVLIKSFYRISNLLLSRLKNAKEKRYKDGGNIRIFLLLFVFFFSCRKKMRRFKAATWKKPRIPKFQVLPANLCEQPFPTVIIVEVKPKYLDVLTGLQ